MKIDVHSLEELRKTISDHSHVSVIGSGHNYNNISDAATQIDISALCKILEVDDSSHIVHAEAGIKLRELNDSLWSKYNLALSSMGDYDEQSLGGIISTSTHGSGYDISPVCKAVIAMEVVLFDGTLLYIQPDAELLSIFKCAIGMVGAIYSVWLKCVPAFFLREHISAVDMRRKTAEDLDLVFQTHEFAEYWLLPHTRSALEITRDKTSENPCWFQLMIKSLKAKIEKRNVLFLMWLSKNYLRWTPLFLRMFAKLIWLNNSTIVDRSYRTFPRQRQADLGQFTGRSHLTDMEYLIPYEKLKIKEIYETIMNFIDEESKEGRYIDFPIHLRLLKRPENILLAPFSKERMVSLSFCIVNSNMQDTTILKNLEKLIVTKYPVSFPHWGKLFFTNPLPRYGKRFESFRSFSLKLDPQDKFLNEEMAHWVGQK